MQTRSRNVLVVAAALAVLAGGGAWIAMHRHNASLHAHALDAIPNGALLVATADLTALRASPVGAPFLRQGREVPGLGKVRDVCGFDPMDTLTEVAVAIPAAGDAGDFGLAAVGAIDDDAVIACASKVIEARGGKPVVTAIGSFRSVRDGAAATSGEIAVRKGGPLLLGGGLYLRTMIDAADDRSPSIRESAAHTMLAREIGDGSVRISVVLTPEQRRTLAEELSSEGASPSPSPAASIVAGALGVSLGADVALHGVIACEAPDACVRLAAMLKASAEKFAADFSTRLVGFGAVLDRVKIEPVNGMLHARVSVPADQAALLTERLLTLRGLRHPMPKEGDTALGQGAAPAGSAGDAGAPPVAHPR